MNTINNTLFYRIRRKKSFRIKSGYSKVLDILKTVLIVISIYTVFGLLFQYVYASTNTDKSDTTNPYESTHGSVWLLPDKATNSTTNNVTPSGAYIEALQMQTDVDYIVTGAIARATVKQRFINSSEYWAEGIYVFPLPENAAVDQFRMNVGDRIIEGQVKERIEARETYEAAKSAGKKTSLIEQQRPNVFTTSLANIAPGESISIEFEYQQVLDYKDERYRLRFPMVVGPRYHTEQIKIDPPANETSVYTETDLSSNNNTTRIHLLLDAGVSLSELNSSYHRIDIIQTSETRYSIATVGESIISDRDFELVWKPELESNPQLSAFEQIDNQAHYAMLTLLPPDLGHLQQKVQARDVIFVLDISGSMSGTSINQAKKALTMAINSLSSIDRFNIIWFNDKVGNLFPDAVTASDKNKRLATNYIGAFEANGGTEMLPALKLALAPQQEFSRFRQVVFLTDGNISNEDELFNIINQQLGENRLFTIGIGSAPNSYFMRKAANIGRGTFTYIGDVNEVNNKITPLFKKLETPALINIELDIDRNKYEVYPNIIPDLYAGETATILIKGNDLPQAISIKGDYGNVEWQHSSEFNSLSKDGIRVAWAREKIASLMSLQHQAAADNEREAIKQEITDTALQNHLVSRYTSLVAVDVTPVNIESLLLRQRLKNNLPYGWKSSAPTEGLMLAQTATSSPFHLFMAFILFVSACFIYRLRTLSQR